ncbi:MAG: radical SAM protein [Prevotella sp.]|nr:radical SAM protein [Prevotella sp.]
MRQYAVNEIFYSIQGEGRNTGRAAVFIRFSGCNLKCSFCDTDHRQHTLMTAKEIAQEAVALVTPWHRCEEKTLVVLTGGEPSLQVDTGLTAELHASIYCEIAMETNGTRMVAEGVDWITLSPKDIFVEGAMPVLAKVDELKVVYDGIHDIPAYDFIEARYRYLQPCDTGDKARNADVIKGCIDFVKSHPQWTLSLQTHKWLGVR